MTQPTATSPPTGLIGHVAIGGHLLCMANTMKVILVSALLFLSSNMYINPASADEINLSGRTYACLIDNIDLYYQINSDPVLIFLNLCPRTNVSVNDILTETQNAAVPVVRPGTDKSITTVISLTKAELSCLKAKHKTNDVRPDAARVVALPIPVCKN